MKNFYGFGYKDLFLLAIEKPLLAQLEITRNCNQFCYFCFRHCNPKNKYLNQSLKDWKEIINRLSILGVEELNFSGGEIFLYEKVFDLFKYAKSNGFRKIIVNTNGTIDLKNNNLQDIDELVFSVHGIGSVHDNITNAPGSFEKLIDNLKYAIKQKCAIGLNTVVTSDNINSINEIYNYFKNFNLLFHSFNLYIDNEAIGKRKLDLEKVFPVYLNFLKQIPLKKRKLRHGMHDILTKNKEFYNKVISLPHCAAGKYKLVVDYLGDVYPCRYFQTKNYYCGNILKENLKKIWKDGKGFKKFRNIILKEKYPKECKYCIKKYQCSGGCLAWRIYDNKLKQYGRDIRCKIGNAYLGS